MDPLEKKRFIYYNDLTTCSNNCANPVVATRYFIGNSV